MPVAAGERYVRVRVENDTMTLRSPSRGVLRELEEEGGRLEVRRVDGTATALAVYAATRPAIAWGNIQ